LISARGEVIRRRGLCGARLGDHLELHGVDAVDPSGGVEDLNRDHTIAGVAIQDHPRLLLFADARGRVAQDHGQGAGRGIIGDLHRFAP
jgi:hypothetical protein